MANDTKLGDLDYGLVLVRRHIRVHVLPQGEVRADPQLGTAADRGGQRTRAAGRSSARVVELQRDLPPRDAWSGLPRVRGGRGGAAAPNVLEPCAGARGCTVAGLAWH
jgi:hypothetical protein